MKKRKTKKELIEGLNDVKEGRIKPFKGFD